MRGSDVRALLGFVVAVIALAGAGLSGLYGFPNAEPWRLPVRIAVAAFAIGLIAWLAKDWSDRHPAGRASSPSLEEVRQTKRLTGDEASVVLAELEPVPFQPHEHAVVEALAQMIIEPWHTRQRLTEHQDVSFGHVRWRVQTDLTPSATQKVLGRQLVLITRHPKGKALGDLAVEEPSGLLLRVTLDRSLAILLRMAEFLGRGYLDHIQTTHPTTRDEELAKVARILSESTNTSGDATELINRWLASGISFSPRDLAELHLCKQLLEALGDRRVVFAELTDHAATVRQVTYTYSTRNEKAITFKVNWWTAAKGRVRRRLHLPPTYWALDISRARAVDSYRLYVTVPEGLYIESALVLSEDRVFARSPVDTLTDTHLNWSRPNGRRDIRLAAWQMRRLVGTADPHPQLVVRVTETPPGSGFVAALVALAISATTWLSGVLTGEALRQAELVRRAATGAAQNNTSAETMPLMVSNADVAALIVSLPTLLILWPGLTQLRTSGAHRSLVGSISIVVSLLLAICSVVSYAGRSFLTGNIGDYLVDGPVSYFLLQDYISISLFSASAVNLGVAASWSYTHLRRYLRLKQADSSARDTA